jgi:carboxypeptidase C (cathepsin A)
MEDTDFDLLFEGRSPEEAKRLRKILAEWRIGDEHSFPVQFALLTLAQWRAAARIPRLVNESSKLLDLKLTEYRQQTATLLNDFNNAVDDKSRTVDEAAAKHRDSAQKILDDLRRHAAAMEQMAEQIQEQLDSSTSGLEKAKRDFEAERKRMETAREQLVTRLNWRDWIWFLSAMTAPLVIGILIGLKWH